MDPQTTSSGEQDEAATSKDSNQQEQQVVQGESSSKKNSAESLRVKFKERQNSVVSFSDDCKFHEINLEKGEKDRQFIANKPAMVKSLRYYLMLLALISPFVTTYSRTIINFALTDMIDPAFEVKKDKTGAMATKTTNSSTEYYFDMDNSCPVDDETRARLIKEMNRSFNKGSTKSDDNEKFEWDSVKQGMLKGSYSLGHAMLQIPGGRMSEIYGSHRVISISAFFISAACLMAPYLAHLNFYLLVIDLFILGILGSFMTPALITMISNWLAPSEKSVMMSYYLVASRLGYALSSLLCGLLIEAGKSWRYVFFSASWVAGFFALVFFLCARSRPIDHPLISELELDYLASKNVLVKESILQAKETTGKQQFEMKPEAEGAEADEKQSAKKSKKKPPAPWLAIITSVPVWAFIITKFCVKFAGDVVQIELPNYLKRVMHFSPDDNGFTNFWNYVMFCFGCLAVGALARSVVKRRPFGMSKTVVRKIFQATASFSVALILLGLAYSVCNITLTKTLLLSFFLMTTFGVGGEGQIPIDITERYSGTIHALGSSIAITGTIEPLVVGYFTKNQQSDKDKWKYVWMGASAIAALGGFVFVLFGDATVQPFDKITVGGQDEKDGRQVEEDASKPASFVNGAFEKDQTASKKEEQVEGNYRESVQI